VANRLRVGPLSVSLKTNSLVTPAATKKMLAAAGACLTTLLTRKNRLALDKSHDYSIHLETISDDKMAKLNHIFRGKDGPTDVLAFPIDAAELELSSQSQSTSRGPDRSPPDPGDMPLLLGDVVVCPAVAHRQAPEHAGTPDDELGLLVVHGILHVLGLDHDTPDATTAMRARELELLREHHWCGDAPSAFRQDHDE